MNLELGTPFTNNMVTAEDVLFLMGEDFGVFFDTLEYNEEAQRLNKSSVEEVFLLFWIYRVFVNIPNIWSQSSIRFAKTGGVAFSLTSPTTSLSLRFLSR